MKPFMKILCGKKVMRPKCNKNEGCVGMVILIIDLKTAPDGPTTLTTAFTLTFKPLERLTFSGTFSFKPGNRKRSG